MTGCRAASLPYRVKACRRGCLLSRTGGSVVLLPSQSLTTAIEQWRGAIPSKRIQQIPDHFPPLGESANQDNASGSYSKNFRSQLGTRQEIVIVFERSLAAFGDLDIGVHVRGVYCCMWDRPGGIENGAEGHG